ncbi:MAG: ABC transporter permease [Coprobacillaceae bacterium]
MDNILTVVKKEFKDILRDRKTLVMTFLIPILFMPLLFTFIFSNVGDMAAPSEDNKYNIIINSEDENVLQLFKSNPTLEIIESSGQKAIDKAYDGEALVYVDIDTEFTSKLMNNETPSISLYYDTTSQKAMTAVQVVQSTLTSFQTSYVSEILKSNGLPDQALQPFEYVTHAKDDSVDSFSSMMLGMLVPMMLIGYSANGILPIATDLGAGEKERGTLEPLLSTGVSRNAILVGKLIVISTFGVVTCVLSAIGLFLSFSYGLESMNFTFDISTTNLLIMLGLSILYSIFMSALLLMVSTYARTLKEANTYLTPCSLIPMLLSIVTMYMDTADVSMVMLNIPVLNVVTVIKEIVVNQLNYTHLYITIAWSVVYILIALFAARKMYDTEQVIFRT